MREGSLWRSDVELPPYPRNLATMLNENAAAFAERPMYQEARSGAFQTLSWREFQQSVAGIQAGLQKLGLKPEARVAIMSPNRREMLQMELAVMSAGAVAVPIFAGYPPAQADRLVDFCEPTLVAVADRNQLNKLTAPEKFTAVIHFDPVESVTGAKLVPFTDLLSKDAGSSRIAGEEVDADTVCLMMYTSGTMGKPKCVQLTHRNILSQQAAMRKHWDVNHHDRFLSYLPWHHSFGGIYEKYAALANGALLSLEHGYGKNIDILLENWRQVRPTVFFSVPRVYQELVTQIMQKPELESVVFHDELKFIFTAAAPLPKNISDIFEQRGVLIYEGWGLTETSPCCTVTDPRLPRQPGVVGKPIAGVALKLADDGEILVQGPNVMKGYFKNPEETQKVLSSDGWFATGDVGEFTETGLRLISRKDRIFKLSNAEKVVPSEIENLIVKDCCFLAHAFVAGSGRERPVALLFPNKAMFSRLPEQSRLKLGCACPRGPQELAKCLRDCLRKLNESQEVKYARLKSAMLVDYELTIENEELTPSMKLAPNVVGRVFKANIERLYGCNEEPVVGEVYVIELEE
jgi:long-subunit acyl-CoA synthetase (AMP-forming)